MGFVKGLLEGCAEYHSYRTEVRPNRTLIVTFDRRCHNPILREAAQDKDHTEIPWLGGLKIKFHFV